MTRPGEGACGGWAGIRGPEGGGLGPCWHMRGGAGAGVGTGGVGACGHPASRVRQQGGGAGPTACSRGRVPPRAERAPPCVFRAPGTQAGTRRHATSRPQARGCRPTPWRAAPSTALSPDPTASITLADTKFSEGISSSPLYCRFFSCSMMSSSSGSTSDSGAFSTLGHCTQGRGVRQAAAYNARWGHCAAQHAQGAPCPGAPSTRGRARCAGVAVPASGGKSKHARARLCSGTSGTRCRDEGRQMRQQFCPWLISTP